MKVLDKGFVELVDILGDDHRILQAARVSTGGTVETTEKKDRGLIKYLYRNRHTSPFEKVVLEFYIKCPIFVARQWMRHRTWSYNEYSARYSNVIEEYYIPDNFRKQGEANHQGSGDEFTGLDNRILLNNYISINEKAIKVYKEMLKNGVAREMARMVLPVSMYTEFYGTVNLWNLFHFLELRLHEHAQFEIREFARAILYLIKINPKLQWSVETFKDNLQIDRTVQELKNAYFNTYEELHDKLNEL